ncbi:unnamed protein product [Moneuplotes crassus]|uniref:Uncharacterized protein n=1 Tax=Euplotes crassus TaxID=5936 RepID=A0AAD1U2Z5_EUPCR|nr:unnamed protein product [Moneuplotes crassus]
MDLLQPGDFEVEEVFGVGQTFKGVWGLEERYEEEICGSQEEMEKEEGKAWLTGVGKDEWGCNEQQESSLFEERDLENAEEKEFYDFGLRKNLNSKEDPKHKVDISKSSSSNFQNFRNILKVKNQEKIPLSTSSSPKAIKMRNYTMMVDCLLGSSMRSSGVTELSLRKDVIHKRILRGFKKCIVKLFDSIRIRPCRLRNGDTSFKLEMIREAQRLNIINSEQGEQIGDFSEFLCWMAMSKNTKKTKSLFDVNNKSILLMDEILTKYSHSKLGGLYGDSNIRMLFHYFISNGLEDFLDGCPSDKRDLYQKCAQEIYYNFSNYY